MATRSWSGAAGDGSFSTVGNWTAGVVPVTGDSVIVLAGASSGMSTNLDRSADGAGAGLNIVDFTIQRGFAYDIGASGNPLRLTADKFTDNGNGNLYFTSDTGTADLDTDRVIIDKGNVVKTVYLNGDSSGGLLSNMVQIEVVAGSNVYISDGSAPNDVTTIWLVPRSGQDTVRVTGNAAATYTTVHMFGGEFIVNGIEGGTINLGNGVVDFRSTAIAVLNQYGGLVVHNSEASNYPITLYNAVNGYMISDETPGTKLITTLNRSPQWDKKHNPKLTISNENYIGG
jgi:hypothetical protein